MRRAVATTSGVATVHFAVRFPPTVVDWPTGLIAALRYVSGFHTRVATCTQSPSNFDVAVRVPNGSDKNVEAKLCALNYDPLRGQACDVQWLSSESRIIPTFNTLSAYCYWPDVERNSCDYSAKDARCMG